MSAATRSQARQRMSVLAVCGAFMAFTTAAIDVILPLWATQTLGLSDAQWAEMRSVRMVAAAVGAVVVGLAATRIGPKAVTIICLIVLGLFSLLLAWPGFHLLWLTMAAWGALGSNAFLNLIVLAQEVSEHRRGLANSIYRSVGTAARIVAPVAITALSVQFGNYHVAFGVIGTMLLVGACFLLCYPANPPQPAGPWRKELSAPWRSLGRLLKNRPLFLFLAVSQSWLGVLVGVTTFAAIRFTRDLGMSVTSFGLLMAASAALNLLLLLASGTFLDRVSLRFLLLGLGLGAGIATLALGLSETLVPSCVSLLAVSPLMGFSMAPMGMWISRVSESHQRPLAFSMLNILSSVSMCLCLPVIALMESWWGVAGVLRAEGVAAITLALLFLCLQEPGREPSPPPNRVYLK